MFRQISGENREIDQMCRLDVQPNSQSYIQRNASRQLGEFVFQITSKRFTCETAVLHCKACLLVPRRTAPSTGPRNTTTRSTNDYWWQLFHCYVIYAKPEYGIFVACIDSNIILKLEAYSLLTNPHTDFWYVTSAEILQEKKGKICKKRNLRTKRRWHLLKPKMIRSQEFIPISGLQHLKNSLFIFCSCERCVFRTLGYVKQLAF